MTIIATKKLRPGDLFSKERGDVWEVVSYFDIPSFTMKNLRTGEQENFGQGSNMADRYQRLIPDTGDWPSDSEDKS